MRCHRAHVTRYAPACCLWWTCLGCCMPIDSPSQTSQLCILLSRRSRMSSASVKYALMTASSTGWRDTKDLRDGLYDSFYINFSYSLPSALLEQMASAVFQSSTQSLVSQVPPSVNTLSLKSFCAAGVRSIFEFSVSGTKHVLTQFPAIISSIAWSFRIWCINWSLRPGYCQFALLRHHHSG